MRRRSVVARWAHPPSPGTPAFGSEAQARRGEGGGEGDFANPVLGTRNAGHLVLPITLTLPSPVVPGEGSCRARAIALRRRVWDTNWNGRPRGDVPANGKHRHARLQFDAVALLAGELPEAFLGGQCFGRRDLALCLEDDVLGELQPLDHLAHVGRPLRG